MRIPPFSSIQFFLNQLPRIANSSSCYYSVTKNLVGHIMGTKRATGDPLVSKRPDFRGLFGFSKKMTFWISGLLDFLIFGFLDFLLDFWLYFGNEKSYR